MPLRTLLLLAMTLFPSHPAPPPLQLHGVVTLTLGGAAETREPFNFNQVLGTALATDGRIVVLDGKSNQVRLFSAAGKLIYLFGRQGQGPGDFSGPCCLGFDDAGRLWVTEFGNRRFSVFAPGGARATFLWATPMAAGQPDLGRLSRVEWDDDHHPLSVGFVSPAHLVYYSIRSAVDSLGRVLHVDTMPIPPSDSLGPRFTHVNTIPGGTNTNSYPQPLSGVALTAYGPGGQFATAVSSHYAVRWSNAAHGVIAQLSGSNSALAVSAAERAKADSMLDQIAAREHVTRSAMGIAVPATKPVLAKLFFDLDGRLWVQRSVVDGAPNEADVYGKGGVLLERVTWPANVVLSYGTIRGNVAIGLTRDAEDVEQVVRLEFRGN